MQARTVSAPAKINVILEVLGRRADGYHDLWSVLVLVDLCDTVTVAPRKRGILLTVRPPVVPAGPGNLAFRAAEAFFETWGRPGGAAITLRKRIPVGGGLGGEIAALIAERAFRALDAPILRVTAPDTPVPFSPPLEDAYLPKAEKIAARLRELATF